MRDDYWVGIACALLAMTPYWAAWLYNATFNLAVSLM